MAIDKVVSASITDSSVTSAKVASGVLQPNFRNIIINGDMSIAQRSTSVSGIDGTESGYKTVDRMYTEISDAGTWTQSQDTTVPTGQGFATSLKMDCTTADSTPTFLSVETYFEGQNLQYLKKGTSSAVSTTLSFWVRSSKTGTHIAELRDYDNNRTISQAYTISSADTWEKKTLTYAGDTSGALGNDNAKSLGVTFFLAVSSTYSSGTLATSWESRTNANRAVGQVNLADSTSNEWYITGVQLETGTAASDFEFLPVDVNLDRCLRYCVIVGDSPDGRDFSKEANVGMYYTSTGFYGNIFFQTPMRSTPSASVQGGNDAARVFSNGSALTSAAVGLNGASRSSMSFSISTSGATSGDSGTFNWNGAGHYCICDAEL